MSGILEKASSVPNICGIQIAFTGTLIPSTIQGYQIFNNSIPQDTDFQNAYGSKTAFSFEEQSDTTNPGISYKQKFTLRFPNADALRADRAVLWTKVKYIKIMLTNNRHLVLGRNDFEQNARPEIQTKLNDKVALIEFTVQSIMPTGYIPNPNAGGLPDLIPLDLISAD